MASSLLVAFRSLRLGGQNVTTTGTQLQIGSELTVMQSQTGQFASAANLAQSGSNLQLQINNLSVGGNVVQLTGNQTVSGTKNFVGGLQFNGSNVITDAQSGQFASAASFSSLNGTVTTLNTNLNMVSGSAQTANNNISALSGTLTGNYVTRASQVSVNTVIPTGTDSYFVTFGITFSSIPKVQATVEVTGDVMYYVAIRNRTTSGYTALFSDTVLESGVYVNTFASI